MNFYTIFRNGKEIDKILLHSMCEKNYILDHNSILIKGVEVLQPRAICSYCGKRLDEKASLRILAKRLEEKPLRDLQGVKILKTQKKYSLLCGEDILLNCVEFDEIKTYVLNAFKPSDKIKKRFDEILFNKLISAGNIKNGTSTKL